MKTKIRSINEKSDNFYFLHIKKNFCLAKATLKKMKTWIEKEYLQNTYPKRTCVNTQRILKTQQWENNRILKWVKYIHRYLTNEDIKMANKHMYSCSSSYAIKKLEIKMVSLYTPFRTATIQSTDNTKCWLGCGAPETSFTVVAHAKWCRHFGRYWACSYKDRHSHIVLSTSNTLSYLLKEAEKLYFTKTCM